MIYNFFSVSNNVLQILKVFLYLSLLLSSIQHLYNSKYFEEDGLMAWGQIKYRSQYVRFRGIFYHVVFKRKGFLTLNVLRIIVLILLLSDTKEISLIWITFVMVLTFIIYFRSALMCNAADQVNNIMLLGLVIDKFVNGNASNGIFIFFIALLLLISYFTSGILKIYEPEWRNGFYLRELLIARSYVNLLWIQQFRALDIRLYKLFSTLIIFWQVTSFLMPFFPPWLLYAYLFLGFAFHLSTGILLGLGNFIWTFMGMLPTLIYANFTIRHLLHL